MILVKTAPTVYTDPHNRRVTTMTRQTTAMAPYEAKLAKLPGAYRNAQNANKRLDWASRNAHLITPSPQIGIVPEGTAVALSVVEIDSREMRNGGEVYNVGGNYALARSALNRIAQAAGISWDPHLSRRLDDGSDPNYVHYRAVGSLRHLDGTEITLSAEKEMDLREGSPQIQSMQARSKGGDITKQLRELRLHILAHAESKAKNRVIRSLGLKPSFQKEELKKPFVVAKLMWTGQSDDPALRARFAEMTAATFLGGRNALYGAQAAPATPALPAAHAPPPVAAAVGGGDTFDDYEPHVIDEQPQRQPAQQLPPAPASQQQAPPPQQQQAAPPPQAAPQQAPPQQAAPSSGLVIPGGREKDKPLTEASESTLKYWLGRIGSSLDRNETDERFIERDRNLVNAMQAELASRDGAAPSAPAGGADRQPGEDDF